MIRFETVSKRYDTGYEALARVDFEVQAGEMVFLTGHSGAGKSTLLHMLSTLDSIDSGEVQDTGHIPSSVFFRDIIPY